ncbi:MAG TPA: sugar phosphate nucleotidyltransferase [Bacillota bacterium]|nr:sugar phosphate nucleotidyltransferase [Bacillota bacterium]
MKAVIMAGGKGTRLRPLTSNLPKPMVPLLGRPCMEYIIELLKEHGITEIAVTLQYLPESIKNYFGDGSDFGVKIVYFEESIPLGTAGSVKNCEEFLDDRFLVISGDALTDFNLREAIEYHVKNESVATMILSKVENPLEYGVVMTNDAGHITRFLEKPSWSEVFSDTVNTGIYILEPFVLSLFEKNVEFDFSKNLFPILLSQGQRMMGYIANGYWSDIGNLEIYRQAQFDILDRRVDTLIKANQVKPGIYVEEDVLIAEDAILQAPIFIGRGTYVEDHSLIEEYSIIGRHNVIKNGTIIRQSVLWDHNYISAKAELNGTTVCNRSMIGECAQLAEGVIMGDACRIGANASIKAGVKIWPDKEVEQNSMVHTSIIWGTKQARHLFGALGIKGIPNIDITPDFAARLASAMSTQVKAGAVIALSSCPHPFSQLIKLSLLIGLNASGIQTLDFGKTFSAAARYGIKAYSVNWGIHIHTDRESDGCVQIEIFDSQGLPIDKGFERRIENAYWQEDFVRATTDKLGANRHVPTVEDDYLSALLREIPQSKVRSHRFNIVLDYDPLVLGHSVMSLLSSLGCQVIQIHAKETNHLGELVEAVRKNRADLGIRLDQDARQYSFVTDKGKIVTDDLMIALHLFIHSGTEAGNRYKIGIPVSAPKEIEWFAHQLQIEVVRTKETARELMLVGTGQKFQPLFDGLYSLVRVIGYLAERRKSFSEIILELPAFHMARKAVFCDWKNKGKVMRMMMEESKGKQVELLDGIKVFDSDGWVLIMPDMDQPHVRVITQAASNEMASTLAQTYVDRIQKYQTN